MIDKKALDNYLQNILEQHNIAGMSVAVTDKNGVIYANGFGVESTERPVLRSTPETLYKIASVSKVFNAANIMCLMDQGLLDLDTPVKQYIPELELSMEGAADIVTLRHLLTHTAGFTGYTFRDLTEDLFDTYLYSRNVPDPELIIRPSGELRLSNFLLWQCAYAEFYYTDVLWPDFSKEELHKAIAAFQRRDRRFGGGQTAMRRRDSRFPRRAAGSFWQQREWIGRSPERYGY